MLFDNLFEELFNTGSMLPPWAQESLREDPVRVTQGVNGENYVIRAVAPGFADHELHVAVNGNQITVSGKQENTSATPDVHSSSRMSFIKSVMLPQDAAMDKIDAEYRNGILAVTVPRNSPPRIESKTVPIKALGTSDKS